MLPLLILYLFLFSRIQIQAVNEIGAGPFSEAINVKTNPLPPLPPRLECAAAGPQSLKLKWGESGTKFQTADDVIFILQIEDKNKRYVSSHFFPCLFLSLFTWHSMSS